MEDKNEFFNSYNDEFRAHEYSKLEFQNTYYLAFRDLPEIFSSFVTGKKALDFGCGTGRSTRFLHNHGFDCIGIDISKDMISIAKKLDTNGEYQLVKDNQYHNLQLESFDLILSAFTFDNIPMEKKETLFSSLIGLLKNKGIFINLVSSPEMYTHEWASFSTKQYPQNKFATTGDVVPIITTDFKDIRPCYDIFCTDQDYKTIYSSVKFHLLKTYKPLAKGDESYSWKNETTIAPWTIYVLQR